MPLSKALRRIGNESLIACGARGGVDDQVDVAVEDAVDAVRPALAHLVDALRRAPAGQERRACRRWRPARSRARSGPWRPRPRRPCRCPAATGTRCPPSAACAGADLALAERGGEGGRDAHDLAGRAHLRAEDGVDARELREREHRLLDRDVRGRDLLDAQLVSVLPAAMRAATFASGTPIALDTNGTVRDARGLTSRM